MSEQSTDHHREISVAELYLSVSEAARTHTLIQATTPAHGDSVSGDDQTRSARDLAEIWNDFKWSTAGKNMVNKAGTQRPSEDVIEAVVFRPAVFATETPTPVRHRRRSEFARNSDVTYSQETCYNPATGEEEPAVDVHYTFNPRIVPATSYSRAEGSADAPAYRCPDGRSGNYLRVSVRLPKSIADQLQEEVVGRKNTPFLRDVVGQIVTQTDGTSVSQAMWDGEERDPRDPSKKLPPTRPPYDDLPSDWSLNVYTPSPVAPVGARFDQAYVPHKVALLDAPPNPVAAEDAPPHRHHYDNSAQPAPASTSSGPGTIDSLKSALYSQIESLPTAELGQVTERLEQIIGTLVMLLEGSGDQQAETSVDNLRIAGTLLNRALGMIGASGQDLRAYVERR